MAETTRVHRWWLVIACLFSMLQVQPARAAWGQAPEAVYLSPPPWSQFNPPGTAIAVRYGDPLGTRSLGSQVFTIVGSLSGEHTGKVILADDGLTAIFKPDRPFTPGEAVQVHIEGIASISGEHYPALAGFFWVSTAASLKQAKAMTAALISPAAVAFEPVKSTATAVKSYLTAPGDFPQIMLNVPANGTSNGYLFASNFLPAAFSGAANTGSYLLILDDQGEPIYYQPVPSTTYATDFKVLPDGRLAYWEAGAYHLLDNTYREVQTINPGNGYIAIDPHELLELPNGHFLFVIDDFRTMDLTAYGGKVNATVVGNILQELDNQGNVVFQWNSFDHIPVTDTNQDLTAATVDYIHANAIAMDTDGNLLISSRHLSEITKIDHQTGAVIWRLGGKANQFSFSTAPGISDDPHFYYQHGLRVLANGDITLFDNHYQPTPFVSRALEFALDETNKAARLIWEFEEPTVASSFMGNAQRLANGDTLIGWGGVSSPAITEVRPDGGKALELSFAAPYASYRAVRYTWQGFPTSPPSLVVQSVAGDVHLAFSWNGATEIASYKVFGSNSPGAQTSVLVAEQPKNGFETSVNLIGIQAKYCFYQVMPFDRQGQPTQASTVVQNPACSLEYLPVISR